MEKIDVFNMTSIEKYRKEVYICLSELDELLNTCYYFQRTKGNDGYYIRENKQCYVNGTWTGYELNTPKCNEFKQFLLSNGWINDWYKLMDRYTLWLVEYNNELNPKTLDKI